MATRDQILRLFPARTPVDPEPRIIGGERADYGTRELIEYAVAPGERVRAFVLTPANRRGRVPGVLASHQHNAEYFLGKSEPAGLSQNRMYHYGVELCREGYVVICPDHLGFEDRTPSEIDRREGTAPADRLFEGFCLGDQLLRGSSLAAKYTFDMCQALDLLASLESVDADRLGVLGHSLGGLTTLWLTFFDERVRVGFSSCGFDMMESIQRHRVAHGFASYLPGLLTIGDMDDVVAAIAPRAFGMSHGRQDRLFPMDGVELLHARAKEAFPPDKVLTVIFDGPHSFPDEVKAEAYAFLASQLGARKPARPIGGHPGLVRIPPEFMDPLPDDIIDGFYGPSPAD